MCVLCAMTAATGVAGARSYLQSRRWSWLTPKRLRRFTVGLFVVGILISVIAIKGSTPGASESHHAPATVQTKR